MTGPPRHCSLDDRKRLMIPSEWRALVKTKDFVYVRAEMTDKGPCLVLMPPAELDARLEKLKQVPLSAGMHTNMSTLAKCSEHVKMDKLGRIRICDKLLKLAEIEEKAVAIPAFTCLELWSQATAPAEESLDELKGELKKALAEMGI